jgi:hypothetical protein
MLLAKNAMAALLLLSLAAGFSVAQGDFDVTQVTADPNSKLFSDGRHTVQGYVLAQLQEKTTCCGPDDIYVEIRYDESGNTSSVRVLQGTNECNRQSIPDILKYIRWSVPDRNNIRPVFLALRPVVECRGGANENVYTAIAPPRGWTGQAVAQVNAVQQQATQVNVQAQQMAQPVMAQQQPVQQPQAQQPAQQQPANAGRTAGSPQQPAQRAGAASPRDTGTVVNGVRVMPATLPNQPAYRGTDRQSNPQLRGNHANVAGPQYSAAFSTNSRATAIYMKKKLREAGICNELAHFLVELELAPDGAVTGLRFLNSNSQATKSAAINVLTGMRFQTSGGRTTYSIFEFKSFIDCNGDDRNFNLSSVPEYFIGPGEQGRPLQTPTQQPAGNNGSTTPIGLPTDR